MKPSILIRSIFCCTALLSSLAFLPFSGQAEDPSPLAQAQALSRAFEQAAKVITPSVVNVISSKKARPGPNVKDPFFDQFREFFGDDFMQRFGNPQGQGEQPGQQGMGTGVIIDSDGHILTNNHVIGDADEVTVKLHDDRSFKATVIGKDERTDLAVIKIKADHLTAAKLGDSDALNIGQWVVAAGNPFGLDNTITAGIVSAKGRSIMGGNQYEDFIQTDAAINPGNSGGPLVDLEGKVVGINTAIFSRSGGYMGIGFAIPSTMARRVMDSLISSGKVVRGWLGVGIQNLTEDLAASFNHTGTDGALIGHVDPTGPAKKAGIEQGDIVVELNGEHIKNVNQLRNYVATLKPGTAVKANLIRDSKELTVTVTIGELPAQDQAVAEPQQEESDSVGLIVEDLTPEIARRIHSTRQRGVVVSSVQPGSVAQQAGVQQADIVLSINGKSVENVQQFRATMKRLPLTKGVRLVLETQGMERFVFLRAAE